MPSYRPATARQPISSPRPATARHPPRQRLWAWCTGLVLLGIGLSPALDAAEGWQQRVDPWVLDHAADGPVETLVLLTEQADVSAARHQPTKEAKGRFVYARLRDTATRTQAPLRHALTERGITHRPFWIANMIWVEADRSTLAWLASRPEVDHLYANPSVALAPTPFAPRQGRGGCPQAVEPSLVQLGAPALWGQGITGQGVIIAGQDTGYEWDHPALRDQYLGWDGTQADHDYHWYDAIHSNGGVCGADAPAPCDDNGHGTHTMGTMVGDNGSHRLGMAPGARWIGCRNMDRGNGTPATYSECMQFFLAPTDRAGQGADPGRAPHVVNNSWACPPFEGCTDPTVFETVIGNLRAAGILMVAAAGNSGSGCTSIDAPPAIYDDVFTVGAVDAGDVVAGFSSRGPVTVDGSGRMTPDVAAPGVSICSSVRSGGYGNSSGTSMASPHVAGLAALLIAARPCLAGHPEALEDHLRATALPRTTTQTCGGVPGTTVPNHTYGYGAVRADLPPATLCTGFFQDGFESGNLDGWTSD